MEPNGESAANETGPIGVIGFDGVDESFPGASLSVLSSNCVEGRAVRVAVGGVNGSV